MAQFREEVSAASESSISAIGDISIALEAALALEREKAEQERDKFATEVVSLLNAMVEKQHARFFSTIDNAKQSLATSQNRVQDGYKIVSEGLGSWVERETVFSKKLLGNKDDVKKSIVDAAKVPQFCYCADNRLLTSDAYPSKRARNGFMLRLSSLSIVR
jgi:hypothetical protein